MLFAQCAPPSDAERVTIERVVDGDTVRLSDGRAVRLLGVNTPELGYRGAPDQPLAREAREALVRFVGRDRQALLALSDQGKDRHGRWLGRLFSPSGESYGSYILNQGLGFLVVIPPDIDHLECWLSDEQSARHRAAGVWGQRDYRVRQAEQLESLSGGFQRLAGVVESVQESRRSWWVELKGYATIKVSKRSQHISGDKLKSLVGQRIEARGWLIDRRRFKGGLKPGRKPFMLSVEHPFMVNYSWYE